MRVIQFGSTWWVIVRHRVVACGDSEVIVVVMVDGSDQVIPAVW